MNEGGKSDKPVVPVKPPNNAASAAAEAVEGRGLAEGNTTSKTRPGHSAGPDAPSALDRVREVARRDKEARFTALLHHVDFARLWAAYWAIRPQAAPGVDGVTWSTYGQDLEANLRDLHAPMRPLAIKSAGGPGASASVVHHVGRTSGRSYSTPVGAVPTYDGFVIALPYGLSADWLKNVLACGSATICHDGHTYDVDRPEVVPLSAVEHRFSPNDLRAHRLFGWTSVSVFAELSPTSLTKARPGSRTRRRLPAAPRQRAIRLAPSRPR